MFRSIVRGAAVAGGSAQREGLCRLTPRLWRLASAASWCRLLAVGLLAMTAGWPSFAGTTTSTVQSYGAEGNAFRFKLAVPIVSPPGCASLGQFAVSLDTTVGRSIADQIIAAKASNFTVTIIGQGYCSALPTTEDVRYIAVSGSPTVTALVGNYWAGSTGATSCLNVCQGTGGFSAARANGSICKGSGNTENPQEIYVSPGNPPGYYCGSARTAQCSCLR